MAEADGNRVPRQNNNPGHAKELVVAMGYHYRLTVFRNLCNHALRRCMIMSLTLGIEIIADGTANHNEVVEFT
jgi:hypothetical protein